MFLIITVNIKTVLLWLECRLLEMSVPLINAIVNNALLPSNSRIKQMPPQIIHILRFLW